MWKKISKQKMFELAGGLALSRSELAIDPGQMVLCQGWEIDTDRGYKTARGYERFDGQQRPSETGFVRLNGTISSLEEGVTLLGGTSGARGVIVGMNDSSVFVYPISGDFEDSELAVDEDSLGEYGGDDAFYDGDEVIYNGGYIEVSSVDETADTEDEYRTYSNLAKEYARALIETVPGGGPIRGVWSYKGKVYAFRDDDASTPTECLMYESSSSGWQVVTTPTLAPSGKYRFTNFNFTGYAGSLTMYGVDGKNKGFSFDGTTFTQITTGMATDTPTHVIGHRNHLFFIFAGGSLQHSSVGDPTTWSPVTGAAELSVGDEITDVVTTPGGVMVIFCRNSIHALYGSAASGDDAWVLKKISDNYGAIEDTVQNTIAPLYIGDAGISLLPTTDKFGDFDTETISYPVQKLVKNYKENISCSVTMRHKNQYRLCFNNGEILILSFLGEEVRGYTMLSYPIAIRCISSSLRSDRDLVEEEIEKDYIFFGSDDGYVYQMDAGTSFDGEEMPVFFKLPPFHAGAPRQRKRFGSLMVEAESESGEPVQFYVKPDYSLFEPYAPEGYTENVTTEMLGGNWNEANWNEMYWSGSAGDKYYECRLDGTGAGVALTFGSVSALQEPFTVKSVTIRYTPRAEKR